LNIYLSTEDYFSNFKYLFKDINRDYNVLTFNPYTKLNLKEKSLMVFTGGEDVTPSLYGEINTYSDNSIARDREEVFNFHVAKRCGWKVFGVCRGHQFLNVMQGGRLIQHITNYHNSLHSLENNLFNFIDVNSTHHQGVIEVGPDINILATHKDIIEATMSKDRTMFSVQFHPEFESFSSDSYTKFIKYLENWINE
jgi:putative glutamine amidotransferase